MKSSELAVIIAGQVAGTVVQGHSGQLSFSYDASYGGIPLSLSMPVGNRIYGDKRVRPFLCGLLPDDPRVRRSTALEFGVSGNNPFALLTYVGLDCPGAIQLCRPDAIQEAIERPGDTTPLSDEAIGARLRQGRTFSDAAWISPSEHWSLGGQQSKFALRNVNGAWHSCSGAAATTHIFKCGISSLAHQALNEYLCLKLASACGILSVQADYREFATEPAIIVKRYDRETTAAGDVVRFHQEDLCQALGVLPENKYPEYGGPSAIDVVRLLRQSGRHANSNINRFTAMLFFNYLIGAPDAHAKNYSLLLGDGGEARLAPLYDVASALPYQRSHDKWRIAMSIGGENRLGRVGRNAVARFAENAGLPVEDCVALMATLAEIIPMQFNAVVAEAKEQEALCEAVTELQDRWEKPLTDLCKQTLSAL